ncbi:MAG TPA: hypothetical protein VKZ96_01245, partial [Thermomicrobiales bacterium]|nr:hypothetical protein [Thermomicrobiales bacterium]
EARDARAEWATRERRDGRLVQNTQEELTEFSVGGQLSQLVFGSFLRRKPKIETAGSSNQRSNGNRR